MGKFNNKIEAEFSPPKTWELSRALSYQNDGNGRISITGSWYQMSQRVELLARKDLRQTLQVYHVQSGI